MLVALQRPGEARRLPPAAEHVAGLLRSWGPGPQHLTGLALVGVTVPSGRGPRFVDALVFTRYGLVVVAAHEPGTAEWPEPEERAGAGVTAARGALAAHDGGRYVTGLVALVPPGGDDAARPPVIAGEPFAPAALGEKPLGQIPRLGATADAVEGAGEPAPLPRVAVVLADPRGLRRIIGQHNRWRTVWSADDVLDACYALSLAHLAPPRVALLDDGFPARVPALSRLPELPAVVPVPVEPPPSAEPETDEPGPVPRRAAAAVFPQPRPIRIVPWRLVFVLTLLVTAGVIAAVVVGQVFHGS
ncbi:hypothetical protein SAMN04489730_5591 [Amycolatopsis australiensis]|uniref:Nuclease-related domain-containing protein n=1 Tax=Amycolatopsis australiensis TaxID=546364 RepID=A0A1K1SGF7_9PSEU|nr:hypothetical protein SAMN04489730_5591 [Amycolatopsis australiensis]